MAISLNNKKRRGPGSACANRSLKILIQAALLGCFLYERTAGAQAVFMPRPEPLLTPAAVQQYETNEMGYFSPPDFAAVEQQQTSPFRQGPVTIRPHLFYRFIHGEGIPVAGTNHVATTIQEFSPGSLFEIGRHWTLDYTPIWRFYSNKQFTDTLDHSITLNGGTSYEDWVLGLVQRVDITSLPQADTGAQTDQETYSTVLNASYRLNSKMAVDLGLNQNFVISSDFNSYREWSTLDWLNYQFSPGLDAGIGAGFGYVDMETGADMTYVQLQSRIKWRVTEKISLQVHAGAEDRQFLVDRASDLISPVAGGQIQYQPFEATRLLFNADYSVTPSIDVTAADQNQITENAAISVRLNQRLLKRLYLDLGGEYHNAIYSAVGGVSGNRKDEYYSFNFRLSCAFLKRATAAVFYQISDNSSSLSGNTYTTSQIGGEVGYRF